MRHAADVSSHGPWSDERHRGPFWLGIALLLALLFLLPVTVHGAEAGTSCREEEEQAAQDEQQGGQRRAVPATANRRIPGAAPAPEARVEVWQAMREAKAREMEEPSGPGLLSRIASPVNSIVDGARALNITPVLHGGHQDNSPAIGFRYEKLALGHDSVRREMPSRADLTVEATTSADGHNHLGGEIGIHRMLGLPVAVSLVAEYVRHPNDTFFGLGADSLRAHRSDYRLTTIEGGAVVTWTPWDWLSVESGVGLLDVDSGPGGGGGEPSVDLLFDEAGLPAFDDRTDYARGHLLLEFDWRDLDEGMPRGGGLVALETEVFEELSVSRFDFRRHRAEIQQYIPFFHEQRIIVLRGLARFTEPQDNGLVPFYFMPSLGHGDALRGFDSFRFRDRHALLLTGEYRWVAWSGLEMALFLDAGKVFSDIDELNLRDLETGYGVGFRVHGPEGVVLRLDIARSRERIRPHLSFSHVF